MWVRNKSTECSGLKPISNSTPKLEWETTLCQWFGNPDFSTIELHLQETNFIIGYFFIASPLLFKINFICLPSVGIMLRPVSISWVSSNQVLFGPVSWGNSSCLSNPLFYSIVCQVLTLRNVSEQCCSSCSLRYFVTSAYAWRIEGPHQHDQCTRRNRTYLYKCIAAIDQLPEKHAEFWSRGTISSCFE